MADYNANFTPRAFIRYRALGVVHKLAVRLPRGSNADALQGAVDKIGAVLSSVPSFRYSDWTVLSAGMIVQDTGLQLPLTAPTITAGTADPTSIQQYKRYQHVRFEAVANTGARTNFMLFGANTDIDGATAADLRVASTESGFPTAVLTGLSEISPAFVSIDGGTLTWYPYYNIKINDHFMKKIRGG